MKGKKRKTVAHHLSSVTVIGDYGSSKCANSQGTSSSTSFPSAINFCNSHETYCVKISDPSQRRLFIYDASSS